MSAFHHILEKLTEFRKRNLAKPRTLRLPDTIWIDLMDEMPAGAVQTENRLPGEGPMFQGCNVVFGGSDVEVSA